MPAPPSGLLAALRKGSVARHHFFYMDHSQDPLYAWDGVGVFTYGGNDYLGVAGYVQIEGVSDSGDIQNHDIYVTLNGAGVTQFADAGIRQACVDIGPALATTDLNIRGRAATVKVLWIAEDGTIVDSLLVVKGKGDIVKISKPDDTFVIKARIAPPVAAWDSPPRAYYTSEDQAEKFAGDTGFDYVADLQNVSVSGWSNVAEVGGGNLVVYGGPVTKRPDFHPLQSAVTGNIFGDDANGMVYCGTNNTFNAQIIGDGGLAYELESFASIKPVGGGSAGSNIVDTLGAFLIDGSGVARNVNGKRIIGPSQNTSRFIRAQIQIASLGTAGAETLRVAGSSNVNFGIYRSSLGTSPTNVGYVYDNFNGLNVYGNPVTGAVTCKMRVNGVVTMLPYVEDVTGTALGFSGTSIAVGGTTCKLSSTGVVLSPSGRKIVLQGGDPTKEFLRIWV